MIRINIIRSKLKLLFDDEIYRGARLGLPEVSLYLDEVVWSDFQLIQQCFQLTWNYCSHSILILIMHQKKTKHLLHYLYIKIILKNWVGGKSEKSENL